MRRVPIAGLIVLSVGATAAIAVASDSSATLQDFVCQRALDPPSRAIQVEAVMRPLPGTEHMAMRFQLLEKSASQHSWTQVSGGDLGRWITPENPTLGQRPGDRWIVKKQVVSLAAPATYRFRVGFRWTGAHARGLGTTTRLSRTCFQPELRPDLYVKSITVKSAGHRQAQDQYTAVIGDAGATGAGPFKVQFADGALTETRTVQFLGAHKEMRIKPFLGPPCAQGPATVTVDPNDQVDDYNRANNSLTVSCS